MNKKQATNECESVMQYDVPIYDETIFGDKKEHFYNFDCYDGFAIGAWSHDEEGAVSRSPKEIILMYPELADVLADEKLARIVLAFRGPWDLEPGDIHYGDIMIALGEISDYTW